MKKKLEFLMSILEIRKEFKIQLGSLVPGLFDRKNLVVKCINGQPVTGRDLLLYIKVNCNCLNIIYLFYIHTHIDLIGLF